jgi:hypothetical protein
MDNGFYSDSKLHAWMDIGFSRQTAAVAAAPGGKWRKSLDIQDDLSMADEGPRLEKREREP